MVSDLQWHIGLYAIYDTIFTEIPYFAQLQSFDLVALDIKLQEC